MFGDYQKAIEILRAVKLSIPQKTDYPATAIEAIDACIHELLRAWNEEEAIFIKKNLEKTAPKICYLCKKAEATTTAELYKDTDFPVCQNCFDAHELDLQHEHYSAGGQEEHFNNSEGGDDN